jgi:hypothetical protein
LTRGTKEKEGEDLGRVDGEGVYVYRVEFVQTHMDDASEGEERESWTADLGVKGS